MPKLECRQHKKKQNMLRIKARNALYFEKMFIQLEIYVELFYDKMWWEYG